MTETKGASWVEITPVADEAPLPETAPSAPRLSTIYADFFTLVLQLRAAGGLADAGQLRRRAKELLEQAERRAREAGFSENEVYKASFALVAFADETVHSSDWDEKAAWQNRPLQLERFDRYDAGEEFFAQLDELRTDPHEHPQVLEVYYLCLALGFEGRYQLHGQDQLQRLIENTNAQLRRAGAGSPGDTHSDGDTRFAGDALSPHGAPADRSAAEMQSKVPTWAVVTGGLLVAVLLYVGMMLYISNEAEETVQVIEQVRRAHAGQP